MSVKVSGIYQKRDYFEECVYLVHPLDKSKQLFVSTVSGGVDSLRRIVDELEYEAVLNKAQY